MVSPQTLRTALKSNGMRMTPQRQLILEAIASLQPPITADRVYREVTHRFSDVNIATIYRTFEKLEGLGLLVHTHMHDGVAHYHFADEPLHQHMVCLRCGAEAELDISILDPLAADLRKRYDFELAMGHSAIEGHCHACQVRSRRRDTGVSRKT